MSSGKEYNNESIRLLKGAQRVRSRPEMYLGSSNLDGVKQTFNEIAGNAIDEHLSGYGDDLGVCRYEDGSYSIRDFGRGVPLGWNNNENSWNYVNIYEELHGGAKFNEEENQEILRKIDEEDSWDTFKFTDYPYLIAIGLNGVGAAATQCTSESFTVTSVREKVASRMDYRGGTHVLDELVVTDTDEKNGTFVRWKPDSEVFSNTDLSTNWLQGYCRMLSYIGGFNVTYNDCGKITEFPKASLSDIMKENTGVAVYGERFIHTRNDKNRIVICQCNAVMGKAGKSEYYNNKMRVKGGVHASGVEVAVSEYFRTVSKERGIKILPRDYSGKFSFIVETLANEVSNHGQTKDFIDDTYVFQCIYECVYEIVMREARKGTDWFMDIVEEVIQNAQNRITVEAMSKNVKELAKAIKKTVASSKFLPCKLYGKGDPTGIEYWIVEGDSAGDKFVHARDYLYQCVQKIRGKSLNVWKASLDRLIKNTEIRDMIAALGCGVELGIDEFESFDISKLKVEKIIIGADADIDGKHIIILLFLIFYRLFPQLLYEGRVYVALPPLYVITRMDNVDEYCFDLDELERKKAEIGSQNIRGIVRFKGLGEMESEQLWDTIANPETRRLQQIKISPDDTEVHETLEVLFGKSTELRKRAVLGSLIEGDLDEINDNIDTLTKYVSGLDLNQVDVEEVVI